MGPDPSAYSSGTNASASSSGQFSGFNADAQSALNSLAMLTKSLHRPSPSAPNIPSANMQTAAGNPSSTAQGAPTPSFTPNAYQQQSYASQSVPSGGSQYPASFAATSPPNTSAGGQIPAMTPEMMNMLQQLAQQNGGGGGASNYASSARPQDNTNLFGLQGVSPAVLQQLTSQLGGGSSGGGQYNQQPFYNASFPAQGGPTPATGSNAFGPATGSNAFTPATGSNAYEPPSHPTSGSNAFNPATGSNAFNASSHPGSGSNAYNTSSFGNAYYPPNAPPYGGNNAAAYGGNSNGPYGGGSNNAPYSGNQMYYGQGGGHGQGNHYGPPFDQRNEYPPYEDRSNFHGGGYHHGPPPSGGYNGPPGYAGNPPTFPRGGGYGGPPLIMGNTFEFSRPVIRSTSGHPSGGSQRDFQQQQHFRGSKEGRLPTPPPPPARRPDAERNQPPPPPRAKHRQPEKHRAQEKHRHPEKHRYQQKQASPPPPALQVVPKGPAIHYDDWATPYPRHFPLKEGHWFITCLFTRLVATPERLERVCGDIQWTMHNTNGIDPMIRRSPRTKMDDLVCGFSAPAKEATKTVIRVWEEICAFENARASRMEREGRRSLVKVGKNPNVPAGIAPLRIMVSHTVGDHLSADNNARLRELEEMTGLRIRADDAGGRMRYKMLIFCSRYTDGKSVKEAFVSKRKRSEAFTVVETKAEEPSEQSNSDAPAVATEEQKEEEVPVAEEAAVVKEETADEPFVEVEETEHVKTEDPAGEDTTAKAKEEEEKPQEAKEEPAQEEQLVDIETKEDDEALEEGEEAGEVADTEPRGQGQKNADRGRKRSREASVERGPREHTPLVDVVRTEADRMHDAIYEICLLHNKDLHELQAKRDTPKPPPAADPPSPPPRRASADHPPEAS